MTEAQCREARERHYGTARNEAVDFMLTIEPLKMKGLYKRYRLPLERMDAVQKEALASMESRGVSRQTMNRETAQRLRDRQIDRMGEERMVLFLNIPLADRTYSWITAMLFSVLFNRLYHKGKERMEAEGLSTFFCRYR